MAPSSSHVILKEVEKHIFKHNLIFRHTCMYKQPTLTKQWNDAIFLQIWCSYFRHTGRLFLGCALRLVCCNIIRTSWETKKERLGYRKKYIEEFVWGTSFFWLRALLSMSFCCFLRLLSPPSQAMHSQNDPYKDIYFAMGDILCDDILSKRSLIWKSPSI